MVNSKETLWELCRSWISAKLTRPKATVAPRQRRLDVWEEVYGLPTTMAMLYQVYIQQYLHTTRELNSEPNTQLVDFASNKDGEHYCITWAVVNQLLEHVLCCDVCSGGIMPYCRLKFLMKRPRVGRVRKRSCQKLTLQQYDELSVN